ncbi:reverse transcriptase [Cucumis melo var. makuwa]|uniref:Reverse transcriptase n=1 Tax=Cucumis melo var. makuwa TaxID=1194695 RepID=A0A5A7TUW0_CUCMM|nr:reverse transcriptase [Cucumis melo var. makuwa]TYK03221.1 reverse transcriptase [Cucumis melo var. makuwa]
MIEGPLLGIADVTKPFEVETDASDYALQGVLLQNGHLIAYESSSFVVKMDNSATCHFFTQPKLTSKQARWQEFLVEFDFEFEQKKWSSNQAVDALSRKQEHAAICLLAHLRGSEIGGSDKVEKAKVVGLLNVLPIPTRPWESVSMDFITHLPKVGDFKAILVIIDRFSKYATFIPTTKQCSAEMTAQLFFKHVVKLEEPSSPQFHEGVETDKRHRRAYLEKALKQMKKWADKSDDLLSFGRKTRVALPTWMKIYPVIHVSNLKPYHQNTEDLQRNVVARPIIDLSQKEYKDVEEILAERVRRGRRPTRRIHEYLIKWKNLPVEETSWERVEDLEAWKQKIEDFKLRQLTGMSTV